MLISVTALASLALRYMVILSDILQQKDHTWGYIHDHFYSQTMKTINILKSKLNWCVRI